MKAYDSVRRSTIVEVLQAYKIDKDIIDTIVQIYSNDSTVMNLRDNLKIKFNITSGIRQGCTLSSTIFKMVTYKIMDSIEKECKGIKINDMNINALFYADDGIILTDNKRKQKIISQQLKE